MIMIDLGSYENTAVKRTNVQGCKICNPSTLNSSNLTVEESVSYSPPFTDIGRGLSGSTKSKIWEETQRLYKDKLSELISQAVKQVDTSDLMFYTKFNGETQNSLESLMTSFSVVSRIERVKLLPRNRARINFTFDSAYTTMAGKSISLLVPIILNYQTGDYSVINPGFKVGD